MDWINDIRYIVMPANAPVKGYEEEYKKAYAAWKKAWEKFRSEMDVNGEKLHSDGFLVPQEMGVLFYKNECVGLCSFTKGNLSEGPVADHSWWKTWTPEALGKLKALSTDVMFCSQFTVNPDFAGKGHVVRWKDVMSLCILMRFLHTDLNVMVGILNLTRGMQNVGDQNHGGTVMDPKVQFSFFGKPVDAMLVAYERNVIVKMFIEKELTTFTNALWAKHEMAIAPEVKREPKPLKLVA